MAKQQAQKFNNFFELLLAGGLIAGFASFIFADTGFVNPEVNQPTLELSAGLTTSEKKSAFFDFMESASKRELSIITADRKWLEILSNRLQHRNNKNLAGHESNRLNKLATKYGIDESKNASQKIKLLLERVDIVPLSLILAQGAVESGWGSSRFAKQGNNYFGQWCFKKGCGIKPANRSKNAKHEVRRFRSVNESIRAYLHNLNTNPAYRQFRLTRKQLRNENKAIKGSLLTSGLASYSQEGQVYIKKLNALIRYNKLETRDTIL